MSNTIYAAIQKARYEAQLQRIKEGKLMFIEISDGQRLKVESPEKPFDKLQKDDRVWTSIEYRGKLVSMRTPNKVYKSLKGTFIKVKRQRYYLTRSVFLYKKERDRLFMIDEDNIKEQEGTLKYIPYRDSKIMKVDGLGKQIDVLRRGDKVKLSLEDSDKWQLKKPWIKNVMETNKGCFVRVKDITYYINYKEVNCNEGDI